MRPSSRGNAPFSSTPANARACEKNQEPSELPRDELLPGAFPADGDLGWEAAPAVAVSPLAADGVPMPVSPERGKPWGRWPTIAGESLLTGRSVATVVDSDSSFWATDSVDSNSPVCALITVGGDWTDRVTVIAGVGATGLLDSALVVNDGAMFSFA